MPRPRSMPEPEVLERALQVFWARGYDRTSIGDLSKAVGLGPSSLYNAFGSKLELFRRSIEHYMSTHANFASTVLGTSSDLDVGALARTLLRSAVTLYAGSGTPRGCAMFEGAGAGSPEDAEACAVTLEHKAKLENALVVRLRARAKAGDHLAAPPAILAKSITATMRGLSQLACDGASKRDLLAVADHAAASCVA
ncbi:MAG: TetR/AcrR family transcriptional regulator [Nannocystaceae bacterium]|nr:TetR/AcrR family transcriptional regulator [Nannocystaceae bacterium]